jgi:uncharacterized protein YkwD
MKRLICATVVAMVSVFAGAAQAKNACVTPANVNTLAVQLVDGINAARRTHGHANLNYNPTLGRAAMSHACDMVVHDFFGHTSSNGSNVQARVRDQGYHDCLVAENLAWGYPTVVQIVSGWMNSPGHRSNMLHPRATEMGVGITQGAKGPHWVLVLARPC